MVKYIVKARHINHGIGIGYTVSSASSKEDAFNHAESLLKSEEENPGFDFIEIWAEYPLFLDKVFKAYLVKSWKFNSYENWVSKIFPERGAYEHRDC